MDQPDIRWWQVLFGSVFGAISGATGAKLFATPRAKSLDERRINEAKTTADQLRREYDAFVAQQPDRDRVMSGVQGALSTFRNVEFPSHANRIKSLEIIAREIQDNQNEFQAILKDMKDGQDEMRREIRRLHPAQFTD